jgi:hypothetical protein
MPILIITPDITAETWLGQPEVHRPEAGLGAEADQGEHEAQRAARGAGARQVGKGKAAGRAREQREQGEEHQHADVRGDEVRRAGAAHAVPLALECDQEEGGDRHHLPGEQEADAVARQHHPRHGGLEQVEGDQRRPDAATAVVAPEVAQAVEGGQAGHQEHAGEEERREAVETDAHAAERQRPRHRQHDHGPVGEGQDRSHQTQDAADNGADAADGQGTAIRTRERSNGQRATGKDSNSNQSKN